MATTKALASSSSPSSNSDLTRQASIYSLTIAELQNTVSESFKSFGSMSMDELVRNIWTAEEAAPLAPPAPEILSRQGSLSLPKHVGNKTVEEVWKEISGSGATGATDDRKMKVYKEPTFGEMTLEDFLAKAGVMRDGEVRVSDDEAGPGDWGGFPAAAEVAILQGQIQQQQQQQIEMFSQRFGGGEVGVDGGQVGLGFGEGNGGRVKRRAVQEPVDKVVQQRQKRMIKNRESAARSRERKQAYTVELEALVTQLEEENAELHEQQVERAKMRLKQLLENLIPVDEGERPRPRRVLRKTSSM